MKHSIKWAAAAAFLGASALFSQAQTTNVVEALGIELTALSQGTTVTNGHDIFRTVDSTRYDTHQVIKDLGTATTNTFSSKARLLRVTSVVDATNAGTITVVQDGNTTVDVSRFFVFTTKGGPDVESNKNNHGNVNGIRFSVRTLSLQDAAGFPALPTHFDVQGFDTSTFHRTTSTNHPATGSFNSFWSANGTGDRNGKAVVLDGSVTVNFEEVTTNSF